MGSGFFVRVPVNSYQPHHKNTKQVSRWLQHVFREDGQVPDFDNNSTVIQGAPIRPKPLLLLCFFTWLLSMVHVSVPLPSQTFRADAFSLTRILAHSLSRAHARFTCLCATR